ncbi:MAG: choice-of-anchor D domain-containing protein, partial [Myxococcota bacterium]
MSVDFGTVPIGRVDRARVGLINSGQINLTIDVAELSGGFGVDTGASGLVGQTIAAGNQLDFDVTFAPEAEQSSEGFLRIVSDDTELRLPLMGAGESRLFADLRAEPVAVDFGRVAVARAELFQLALTNTGTADAVIDMVTQTLPSIFRVVTPLPLTVPIDASRMVTLEFAPMID